MKDRFDAYHEALKQGHIAAQRNKVKDALRNYEAAARLADDRAQPHISMARVLLRAGKARDAVAAYERAAVRAPDDAAVLSGLAEALSAAGRRSEAESMREQAAVLANQAAEQSFAAAQQAGALTRAEVLHLAGYQARIGGRTEAAIDAWLDEARSHADEGQLDAALDACQQALTISSGSTRIHVELVRLYFMRGWQELAVERLLLLDRLLELAPEPAADNAVLELARRHAARDGRLATIASRASQQAAHSD
jgi:tetratricopeptide (TPR) repeat protein